MSTRSVAHDLASGLAESAPPLVDTIVSVGAVIPRRGGRHAGAPSPSVGGGWTVRPRQPAVLVRARVREGVMPWYLRKAFRVGPLHVNLSTRGLGASAGVTGARVGVDATGQPYVHGGRRGLY